jgi:hypothetical protein
MGDFSASWSLEKSHSCGHSRIESIHFLVEIRASHRLQIAHRARQIFVPEQRLHCPDVDPTA